MNFILQLETPCLQKRICFLIFFWKMKIDNEISWSSSYYYYIIIIILLYICLKMK